MVFFLCRRDEKSILLCPHERTNTLKRSLKLGSCACLPARVLFRLFAHRLSLVKQWMALHIEGYKTYSEVERAVMSRYFFFHLANVFVTIGAGSIKDVSEPCVH